MSDQLGMVFGALADPTRRRMLDTLMRNGSTSVPALTAELPITRQAVAKHLSTLTGAGVIEREPSSSGREIRYRLTPDALATATAWIQQADQAWASRLERLKRSVETR